jgi:hypothetical protein
MEELLVGVFIIIKACIYIALFYVAFAVFVIASIVGLAVFESIIGSFFGCSMAEGAVLIALSCHGQNSPIFQFVELASVTVNFVLGIVGASIILLIFNPITPFVLLIALFILREKKILLK